MAVLAVSSAETTLISLTVFYRPPLTCKPSQLFSTLENTVIIFLFLKKILHNHCFQFLSRETENNGYTRLLGGQKDYYGIF